jgi:hypothetical protein
MNYALQNSTAHGAMGGGFLVFGICAFFGLRFLIRGLRDDIYDDSGNPIAGRSWFIVGGTFLLLPLVAFSLFAWKQGYFSS